MNHLHQLPTQARQNRSPRTLARFTRAPLALGLAATLAVSVLASTTPAHADFGTVKIPDSTVTATADRPPTRPVRLPDLTVSATGHVHRLEVCLFGECIGTGLGSSADLRIVVQNHGEGPSEPTTVRVQQPASFGGSDFTYVHIPAVPANTILRVDGPHVDCTSDDVFLVVDPDNLVRETNENNNSYHFPC